MPSGVDPNNLTSSYSATGILTIEAPRTLTAPEGATVSESMAAKSKVRIFIVKASFISVKLKNAFEVLVVFIFKLNGESRKFGLELICRTHFEKSPVFGHFWPNFHHFWPLLTFYPFKVMFS